MTEIFGATTLLAQLQRVAMIARLRSDLPVQELLEIGDALLAAPILVVEIPLDFADAPAAIAEFCQRYGDHLLVGAAAIQTVAQLMIAQGAGAHFFELARLDPKLLRFARENQLRCIPQVASPIQAKLARLEGCPLVSVAINHLPHFSATDWLGADLPLICDVDEPTALQMAQMSAVTAIRLGSALFPSATWSHHAIITTARHIRQQWEAAGQ